MKHFLLPIFLIALLASCTFNEQRKSQINRRIDFLVNQMDQRINQEDRLNADLNLALQKFQPLKTGTEAEFMIKISTYDSIIKPILNQLNELEVLDKVNQAEIDKLRQERAQL